MKKLTLLICVLCSFVLLSASPASGSIRINVTYSRAADIFNLMDNVSRWWEGFCDEEYWEYWSKRYRTTKEDEKYFKTYSELRMRHYSDPAQKEKDPLTSRNGFFSTADSQAADPLAYEFYKHSTLEEALAGLNGLLDDEEISFLAKFYQHFEKRYAKILDQNEPYLKAIGATSASMNRAGVVKYLEDVERFYHSEADIIYTVLFLWWPPLDRTRAGVAGEYLLMKYNPLKHQGDASDVAMHEIIHVISSYQPLTQKRKLTAQFLDRCAVKDKFKMLTILEEPLAVVFGQMLFLHRFDREQFDHTKSWYRNGWIDEYSRLLFPLSEDALQKHQRITGPFIVKAADACNQIKDRF